MVDFGGLGLRLPAGQTETETTLGGKSARKTPVLEPSGRMASASPSAGSPRGAGISGKKKGPETIRALVYGAGVY